MVTLYSSIKLCVWNVLSLVNKVVLCEYIFQYWIGLYVSLNYLYMYVYFQICLFL